VLEERAEADLGFAEGALGLAARREIGDHADELPLARPQERNGDLLMQPELAAAALHAELLFIAGRAGEQMPDRTLLDLVVGRGVEHAIPVEKRRAFGIGAEDIAVEARPGDEHYPAVGAGRNLEHAGLPEQTVHRGEHLLDLGLAGLVRLLCLALRRDVGDDANELHAVRSEGRDGDDFVQPDHAMRRRHDHAKFLLVAAGARADGLLGATRHLGSLGHIQAAPIERHRRVVLGGRAEEPAIKHGLRGEEIPNDLAAGALGRGGFPHHAVGQFEELLEPCLGRPAGLLRYVTLGDVGDNADDLPAVLADLGDGYLFGDPDVALGPRQVKLLLIPILPVEQRMAGAVAHRRELRHAELLPVEEHALGIVAEQAPVQLGTRRVDLPLRVAIRGERDLALPDHAVGPPEQFFDAGLAAALGLLGILPFGDVGHHADEAPLVLRDGQNGHLLVQPEVSAGRDSAELLLVARRAVEDGVAAAGIHLVEFGDVDIVPELNFMRMRIASKNFRAQPGGRKIELQPLEPAIAQHHAGTPQQAVGPLEDVVQRFFARLAGDLRLVLGGDVGHHPHQRALTWCDRFDRDALAEPQDLMAADNVKLLLVAGPAVAHRLQAALVHLLLLGQFERAPQSHLLGRNGHAIDELAQA